MSGTTNVLVWFEQVVRSTSPDERDGVGVGDEVCVDDGIIDMTTTTRVVKDGCLLLLPLPLLTIVVFCRQLF